MQNKEKLIPTLLSEAGQDKSALVLDSFLTFLENDIQRNPQHLKAATPELVSRIQNLVGDLDIDLDVPLNDESQ